MIQQIEYKKLDRVRLEIVYKALKYVARQEGVEIEEKHEEMSSALDYSIPETNVSDIPFVLDEIYELLTEFEDIKEYINNEEK